MGMKHARLLGVSWCMPPGLYPRSIQVARLLKGLKPLGWTSTMVTPRAEDRLATDPTDPDLAAMYADCYDTVAVDVSRVDPEYGARWPRWRQRLKGEVTLSPDALWMTRAIAAAKRHIASHRVDALVTFAQPWSDHRIGLALADWRVGLPWVAHFSDPWIDSLYESGPQDERRLEERRTEARVVERADAIVFTNHFAADLVMAKYSPALRAKAHVVPHTTDPELLSDLSQCVPPPASGRPMRLSHVGNLFVGKRRAHAVFEALAILHRRQSLVGRLELVLLGAGSGLYEAREKVFELSLEPIVTFHPRVSHRESLTAMATTDVLLIIDAQASTNVFMPSKVVDYLMARRPILALTPQAGSTADIMRELNYPILDPDNAEVLAAEIERLMHQYQDGTLTPSSSYGETLPHFSLEHTAGAFATILDRTRATRR